MSDNPSALELRCVAAWRKAERDKCHTPLDECELVRAVLAEAGVAELEAAGKLALEYWAHRQMRYKNRSPVWVQDMRAALAKIGATQ